MNSFVGSQDPITSVYGSRRSASRARMEAAAPRHRIAMHGAATRQTHCEERDTTTLVPLILRQERIRVSARARIWALLVSDGHGSTRKDRFDG